MCLQVCGGYVDSMTRCAQLLEEHVQADFVDVNCGCPIDLICNKCARCLIAMSQLRACFKPPWLNHLAHGCHCCCCTAVKICGSLRDIV